MNLQLTEEHLAVRDAARDFAQNVLKPGVIDRDEKQQFATEEIKQLGELGFMGMMVSPKYGGGGMDTISYVLAMEEISKIDASVSVCMSVNNSLFCWGLDKFASEEQKQKYLIPAAQPSGTRGFGHYWAVSIFFCEHLVVKLSFGRFLASGKVLAVSFCFYVFNLLVGKNAGS